ncbi:hypothetical protein HGRIS_009308 [Hohenbuehelia grisea]|uniref:Uncharacterized protein n=1 Tax=Hohenbuehelia grisea TaxID=104357 RepID=A0ABR3J0W6_9AGAR
MKKHNIPIVSYICEAIRLLLWNGISGPFLSIFRLQRRVELAQSRVLTQTLAFGTGHSDQSIMLGRFAIGIEPRLVPCTRTKRGPDTNTPGLDRDTLLSNIESSGISTQNLVATCGSEGGPSIFSVRGPKYSA